MTSLQGHLLVAPPQLRDPNFLHTVVLMVQHDQDGALGLVLNRPLETSVAEAVASAVQSPCRCDDHLYQGGPCEGPLMVLHTHPKAGEIEALPGVFFSTQQAKVEWLLENNSGPIKYFAGYSGWGAGQLEAELAAGGWYVLETQGSQVFDGGENQWRQLVAKIALGRPVNPNVIPEDRRLN
jgi:putative transcriptional regulator